MNKKKDFGGFPQFSREIYRTAKFTGDIVSSMYQAQSSDNLNS